MTGLTYAFGDDHTPTQTYTDTADVDLNGDGLADGIKLDFDGSGHEDAIAWDSDGDGRVDTILVSSHHDGVYDTAYHDPSGQGHWDQIESVPGSAELGHESITEVGAFEHDTSHVMDLGDPSDPGTDPVVGEEHDLNQHWADDPH